MANKSLLHSSLTDNIFYRSMLAGNDAYFPEFESDDFLEEVVLTSSAASVTFSGLGAYSDYKHLQIRAVAKNSGTNPINMWVRANGDTASSYSWHYLNGYGSGVSSGGAGTRSEGLYGGTLPGAETNVFGASIIDFLDFSSTTKYLTSRALSGHFATAGKNAELGSGSWQNVSAVTSLELRFTGGNILAGSRFSLYGSKG